jgi:acetyl-CoA acetyltransferase
MAVAPSCRAALDAAGLAIGDVDAVKMHNPFAVNDIVFAKETGFPLDRMNNYGCSLVWGHPQGPTGMRSVIELIEELALRGGGVGLFGGCAAGDSGMALLLRVSDAKGA